VHDLAKDLVEQIAFEARDSEYVDAKSGVSARLTISAFENLISSAERRKILSGDASVSVRISDLIHVVPAVTGKVELVYEGEQEGPGIVANNLVGKAIRSQFINYFPDPEKTRKNKEAPNPYKVTTDWFGNGNMVDLLFDLSDKEYEKELESIPGLSDLIAKYQRNAKGSYRLFLMEFALYGLVEYSMLSKHSLEKGMQFKDLLSSMFTMPGEEEENDDF